MSLFRTHGITRDQNLMTKCEGSWFYQQLFLGYNYRITDLQCALGCTQLKKLDGFLERRRELVQRYQQAFENCSNIVVPYQLPETKSGWHLYIVQVMNCDRRQVFESLRAKGIGVNVHYIPVYYHPYYRENGYQNTCCPNAEKLYEHFISLPLYVSLTDEEQDYIIQTIKEILENL